MALAIAGCSGATGPVPAGVIDSPYAVFTGQLHLRGEIAVDGHFTDAITGRRETCAQYAEGAIQATTLWVTPTPNNAELVAGHSVSFTAGVAGAATSFHGAGSYAQPGAQVDDLLVDNASFLPGGRPTTSITVMPDGSGAMSFGGLADTSTGAAETGSETWTCTSRATPAPATNAPAPPTGPPGSGPALSGTLSISGAYSVDSAFTTHAEIEVAGRTAPPPAGYACAAYALGAPGATAQSRSFVAPEIDTGGANAAYFSVALDAGYAGPGSYASGDLPGLTGTVEITIPPASAPVIDTFTSRFAGSTRLTVRSDGSGIVAFHGWYSSGSDNTVSGTVTWRCQ